MRPHAVALYEHVLEPYMHNRWAVSVYGTYFPALPPPHKKMEVSSRHIPRQTMADVVAASATKQMSREIESERAGRAET